MKDGGQELPILTTDRCDRELGMTLRQWYAGMALQGLSSNPAMTSVVEAAGPAKASLYTAMAFKLADAMLAYEAKERGE
ncbi:MAG TPA: hypothetical protein VF077_13205 [Nitrospiraceae bacterium]